MNGWTGNILRINLSNAKITREPLEKEVALKYVGGRGLNAKILFDETKPGIDPLGADNKLILGLGPCNGTRVPGSARMTLTAKSPITDMYGTSNSTGHAAAGLKYAGYDAIIIEGQAEKPVYLWINDDNVELRDAGEFWGKNTQETKKALQREVGYSDASVMCIGPAGENLVRFACVASDLGRVFGRNGIGAVMGSKKLKAIVARGTKGVKVAEPELLEEAAREMARGWQALGEVYQGRMVYGLTFFQEASNDLGILVAKNFREGKFPGGESLYAQHVVDDHFLRQPKGCFACCAPRDKIHVITKGRFRGTYGAAIEAGGIAWWGSSIGVKELAAAVRGATLCDTYGIDMSEASIIMSWAMECFEKGILSQKDLSGLKLEWGNADAALKLMEMMVYRQGIGDLFAEGVKRASESVGKGSEKFAMHVKGAGLDSIDPRGAKGWGLGYAVSSRGADHCMGYLISEFGMAGWDPVRGEVPDGKKVDPYSEENKGTMRKWAEEVFAFANVMQICEYIYEYCPKIGVAAQLAKFFNAVTGLKLSDKDAMFIGERLVNLEHAYNIREGWTRKDDNLPERFLKETLPEGPAKGQVVKLEPMLDEYYALRGWDNSGLPSKAKLTELGLEEIYAELRRLGKLD
jgi:aldehyde:ferredoxin oxidoreductase